MNALNKCTSVCGRCSSASKIILVKVYPENKPESSVNVYATIDVASNRSFISPSLCDKLGVKGDQHPYTLFTCAGSSTAFGANVENICVESMDGSVCVKLPSLLECSTIVNDRGEIPDPSKFQYHTHLAHLAEIMPKIDPHAEMGLLIGRDKPQLQKVHETINGPPDGPWAELLEIGWVVMGDMCLDSQPNREASVFKSQVPQTTFFEKCEHVIKVEDKVLDRNKEKER